MLILSGQGLPGPSSTQLVISTAATHGGALGGMIAFIMWCLPGYAVLTLAGMFLYTVVDPTNPPVWLLGVPPAAIALIFKATYAFVVKLDKFGAAIGMAACAVSVMIAGDERLPSTSSQIVYPVLLVGGGLLCFLDFLQGEGKSIGEYSRSTADKTEPTDKDRLLVQKIGLSIGQGFLYLFAWLALLIGSIVMVQMGNTDILLNLFEINFRVGSLIFGGGIVVLPMLQSELVPRGWVTEAQFFQ
jgi:chromate transporter